MSNGVRQTTSANFKVVCVRQLPSDVTEKDIMHIFQQFGTLLNIHLKPYVKKGSKDRLTHPFAHVTYEFRESVDKLMASRPILMGMQEVYVRRVVPKNRTDLRVAPGQIKQILIRPQYGGHDEILPEQNVILDYLQKTVAGHVERYERLDDRTVLIEFDDYDSVDLCSMIENHLINNQPIVIEACLNEDDARVDVVRPCLK
jgi:hypothetical protein